MTQLVTPWWRYVPIAIQVATFAVLVAAISSADAVEASFVNISVKLLDAAEQVEQMTDVATPAAVVGSAVE